MARIPKAIQEQMADNIDAYGWCRANMHIWQHPSQRNGHLKLESHGVVLIVYKCRTCGSERHDRIARTSGELIYRQYYMADHYLVKLGDTNERPRKDDWRKLHVNNLLEKGKVQS